MEINFEQVQDLLNHLELIQEILDDINEHEVEHLQYHLFQQESVDYSPGKAGLKLVE
jgi:hypothetical protein